MIVNEMSGAYRATLLRSLGHLLKNTKAAVGTNAGCFLPTEHVKERVEQIEAAKFVIPPGEGTQAFEIVDDLADICRNAIVLHARILDKKVRQSEKDAGVPTNESDAVISELGEILKALGDDREIESLLGGKKKKGDEAEADPAQMDLVEETAE